MKKYILIAFLFVFTASVGQIIPKVDGWVTKPKAAPGTPVDGEVYYDSTTKKTYQWNGTSWIDWSGSITLDATLQDGSTNGVENNAVFDGLATKSSLTASQTFTGANTFDNTTVFQESVKINSPAGALNNSISSIDMKIAPTLTSYGPSSGYGALWFNADSDLMISRNVVGYNVWNAGLDFELLTNPRRYKFPDKDGTLAMLDDITGIPADNSVTSAKIVDFTIQTDDILAGAITNNELGDLSVTTSKVLDGAITSGKIANLTILEEDLSSNVQNRILNAPLAPKTVAKTIDFTLAATDDIFDSGTDIGRKITNAVSVADTLIVTVPDVGSVGDVYRFRTDGASSGFRFRESGLVVLDWATKISNDYEVRISGKDKYAYLRKTAANNYFLHLESGSYTEIATTYSPNNLYTEASALNADNINSGSVTGLGSWHRATPGNTTYQSVVASTGGTASTHAMRAFRASPSSLYEKVILTKTDWTNGQAYKVRFKYKYVAGTALEFEARNGGTRVVVSNTSGQTTFSTFEYTFTANATSGELWLTLNWGITGADEGVEITDFEILLN